MDLADVRAQLEEDLTWRTDEIRLLRNHLVNIASDEGKNRYRKALIVMLYAHFEGFCKTAFSIYANAINREQIDCQDANDAIVAASLSDVFHSLSDHSKKSDLFRHTLPDDASLHRFARQAEFVSETHNIWSRRIIIPIDDVVDTESNLKPIVLRKILFRLGFDYNAFENDEGAVHKLLNYRNDIAHGSRKNGVSEDDYRSLEESTFDIMASLIKIVTEALRRTSYLRIPNTSST